VTRGGRWRFFRAFALASTKPNKRAQKCEEKKARKKAKAPSAKEKARIHAFSSPHNFLTGRIVYF
jgi:hypothetical protein